MLWFLTMILRFIGWLIRGVFRLISFLIGCIIGLFRRDARRRNVNRWMQNVETENTQRKGVVEYTDCPIETFVSRTGDENIVVSGVNRELRNRVVCSATWNCYNAGRGAVVLHCGNSALVELLSDTFRDTVGLYSINASNPIYDPFLDLDRSEISQLILSSSGNDCRIERNGSSYMYGLSEYLQLMGRPLCVDSYCSCLRDRGYEQTMELAESGRISDFVARRINSDLAQGQMERGNIEQYFNVLKQQGRNVLVAENSVDYAISIKSALRQNQVVTFDLGNASNALLLNVVVQEIREALALGLRFSVVIDSIPLSASESLDQLFRNFSGQCTYVCSSQDVYADTQSTSNVFDTLVGRANSVFVLQHYSAVTCQKFSEFFGEYQMTEVDQTLSSGDTYQTYGQVLPGAAYNDVYHRQHVNRRKVEPQEISGQNIDHAYIRQNGSGDIVSVRCSSGNARGLLTTPRRRRPSGQIRSFFRQINWFLFGLLLLVFPPFAFIYSFVASGRTGKIVSAVLFVLTLLLIVWYFRTGN